MPDITCCVGTGCAQRRRCWRWLAGRHATNQRWQSFFDKPPKGGRSCRYFMRPPLGFTVDMKTSI